MANKFYQFSQNNSGGYFHEEYGKCVIIEATGHLHANAIAESLGIYFNGVSDGIDCPCCGDRWYPVYENDGTEVPMYYSKEVEKTTKDYLELKAGKQIRVVYLDKKEEWF